MLCFKRAVTIRGIGILEIVLIKASMDSILKSYWGFYYVQLLFGLLMGEAGYYLLCILDFYPISSFWKPKKILFLNFNESAAASSKRFADERQTKLIFLVWQIFISVQKSNFWKNSKSHPPSLQFHINKKTFFIP